MSWLLSFFKKKKPKLQFMYDGGFAYLDKKLAMQNGLDTINEAMKGNKMSYEKERDGSIIVTIGCYKCIFDEIQYQKVIKDGWNLSVSGTTRNNYKYVNCRKTIDGKRISKRFHQLIMDAPDGRCIDHINRNPLDNRIKNLRIVTQSCNMRNQKTKKHSKLPRFIFRVKDGYTVIFRERRNGKRYTLCREQFRDLASAIKFRDDWIMENDWFGLRHHYENGAHQRAEKEKKTLIKAIADHAAKRAELYAKLKSMEKKVQGLTKALEDLLDATDGEIGCWCGDIIKGVEIEICPKCFAYEALEDFKKDNQ